MALLLRTANASRALGVSRPSSSKSSKTPLQQQQQNAKARSQQRAGVPAAAAAAQPLDSLLQLQQQQSSHRTDPGLAHRQQQQQHRYSSNPRLLTAHIKRCKSWQQVSDLLSAAGAATNHIHLTAAVTHCAQLHQGSQKQQQQQLRLACSITEQLLHQHAAALELRHSSNLVWALAVLSSGAATDPDSTSSSSSGEHQRLQHLVDQLLELQTQQLQLPALQQQQSSGYGSSSSSSNSRVPAGTAVKPQDLANTVWALSTLCQAPPAPWLQCFWGMSGNLFQQQQQQCSLQELSNMAWAVAKLQLQPPKPWLHALLDATQHDLWVATTQVQQQQQPLPSTRNSSSNSSSSSSSSSRQPVRLAQALSNLAYAVGQLGCCPSDNWVSAFFAASLPQLHNCSHVQLSMLLWGLAEWGPVTVTAGTAAAAAAGGVSLEGWLPVYAARVQQQLPTYSDQALVNTAASCYKLLLLTQHACASTRCQQQQQQQLVAMAAALQQLLGAVLEAAAGRVQTLPVSSASALLWASAGMRGSQQQQQQQQGGNNSSSSIHSWLREYLQAHTACPTKAVAAADVLQLLWLAAKLRECPASDAWLQQHCGLLQQQLEQLTLAQLSQLTWSLAELLESTAAAADVDGGGASRSSSSSGTHQQQQHQHEVVWQHLSSLACTLLQLLPQRLAGMNPQELVESTAAAARIVAVLQHGLKQQGLICLVLDQQQQECALQQAACVLLPVSAAAALPCTAALQPHHLEVLAQAMRLLLKHSTPQLASPAAAAAAALRGSAGVLSSQQLSAVHRWLRAAADAVAAARLPAAATAQVSMQLLALGQAAVRAAARAAVAAAAAAAAAAAEGHASSPNPVRPVSSSHQPEQQQQQLQLQRQRQKHHDWHPVLEQLLSCVSQLEGEQALQAAECSVRLLVSLPRGCLCELLYALQAAVPSFSPHQLLRLLRLMPAWRVTPPAAVKAKQAVLHRWLSAARYVILLQQQKQQQQEPPGAARGSSTGAAAAAAAASQLQFVVAAVQGLEAAHVRPPQPWLLLVASVLAQHLSTHRQLAEQHSNHQHHQHHQQQQQQDASGAGGPSSQAAGVLLSSPETLSRQVLALSRLGYQLEWDSWEAGVLLHATQDALPHMDRSQLVRVLHGLTKMGAVPDSSWLAAFYDRVEAAPGAFHVSGFGMVVWALAKSGAKPHPAWMAALLDSTYGLGGSTVAAAAGAAEPGSSNAATEQWTGSSPPAPQLQRQQQLRPQHLANMLCAFAKLGFTPGDRWMSWFRSELERTSGGQLQELDHFHIEWAWRELNHQYRLAAYGSNSSSSGGGAGSTDEEV